MPEFPTSKSVKANLSHLQLQTSDIARLPWEMGKHRARLAQWYRLPVVNRAILGVGAAVTR
jgi:hypothetical protein